MRELLIPLLLVDFVRIALALSSRATCYFPNGAPAAGNYPCFLDQIDSPCCGGGFICEASGLCKVPHSIGVTELIRGACTDSTWASSSCPNYCTDASVGGTNLISCQNSTKNALDFCCDHTNGCCDSGIGRFQVPLNTDILTLGSSGATISTSATIASYLASPSTTTTSSASSSSSLTFSSASSISTTATPSTTSGSASAFSGALSITAISSTNATESETSSSIPTTKPTEGPNLSTGAKAGIATGCAIVGLVIVGGVVYFCIRKRKHVNTPANSREIHFAEIDGVSPLPEMEARAPRRMGGNYERVELPA